MPRLAVLLLLSACAWSQPPDRFQSLRFLIGEWTGTGGGADTGQGAGAYTFLPELDGKVLVRRSSSDYPTANGRPAIHHVDVMTVYLEADGKAPEAIYFDNEGHVIHYAIEIDAAGKVARFVSPVQAGQPRYRLTYREMAADVDTGQFEVAPPGKPEAFTKYLEWSARRKK
ncbi:MAG: hypothetical protein JWP63_1857 [Candidatus Solibacter sp.]|jgi:hypothetical protein|nr:hypothetical protein [Candidatus Solibacter sp.]